MSSPLSARKLVVLGVPYSVDTDGLKEYMLKFGEIEDVVVLKDRISGRSRGFGYVTFASEADAQSVLDAKHSLGGRDLEVKPATPKEDMGSVGAGGRGGKPQLASTRIFVAKVPSSVTDDSFRQFFEQFGTVTDAYLPKNPSSREHRNIGFITFTSADAVETVMSEPRMMDGVEVAIDKATPKEDKGSYRPSAYGASRREAPGGYGGYAAASPYSSRDAGRAAASPYAGTYGAVGGYAIPGVPPTYAAPSPYDTYSPALLQQYSLQQTAAVPGATSYAPALPAKSVHPTKVFVGKIGTDANPAEIREYFERFGPVEDVYLPKDPAKQGHRGFAFVTFLEEEVAAFVAKRQHTIGGKQVVIERATPPDGKQGGRGSDLQGATASASAVRGGASSGAYLDPSQQLYGAQGAQLLQQSSAPVQYASYADYGVGVGTIERGLGRQDARYRPY